MAPKKAGPKGVAVVKATAKKVVRTDGWYAKTVPELKTELRRRGALVGGVKDELVGRLNGLDAEGKTGDDTAAPVKAGGSKKSGAGDKKGTTSTKAAGKKPAASTEVKGGRKAAASNRSRATSSPSPGIEDTIGTTATGRVIKVTAAHKKFAEEYQNSLDVILRRIEIDHGAVDKRDVSAVEQSVFGPTYQSLKNASYKLAMIETNGNLDLELDDEEGSVESGGD